MKYPTLELLLRHCPHEDLLLEQGDHIRALHDEAAMQRAKAERALIRVASDAELPDLPTLYDPLKVLKALAVCEGVATALQDADTNTGRNVIAMLRNLAGTIEGAAPTHQAIVGRTLGRLAAKGYRDIALGDFAAAHALWGLPRDLPTRPGDGRLSPRPLRVPAGPGSTPRNR